MSAPSEKLAKSLSVLRELQKGGRSVFRSKEFTRVHRERLLRNGFLQEVLKGWLISASPGSRDGDSTPWYASFWEFCACYCNDRFGEEWHLSPEQSLFLHAENTVIPSQVIIYSPKGTNNTVNLSSGTSLYDLKQSEMPPPDDVSLLDGLRVLSREAALIRVSGAFFSRHPVELQIILASFSDASGMLRRLPGGGHSIIAGRLAGAFRRIGCPELAHEIMTTMRAASYTVRETDPFVQKQTFGFLHATTAPVVGRLQSMWKTMREPVVRMFPKAPGLPKNTERIRKDICDLSTKSIRKTLTILCRSKDTG
ncbi:MAG: hypothetical protein ACYCTV_09810 [Leptospirales bacterium]